MSDTNDNGFAYEEMVEKALRGVLREALEYAVGHGLPGEHHFYITFDTNFPEVDIHPSLKAVHPEEMTIVLQHQFWDLTVTEAFFEVTLSFSGVSRRLHIPFAAVTAFADPHAKFGLQFHVGAVDGEEEDEDGGDDMSLEDIDGTFWDNDATGGRPPESEEEKAESGSSDAPGDGNVVTLDAFRKK